MRFAQALAEGSPFATRAMFVDNDGPTLARAILAMEPADYAAAFKASAIKRAKLWMLQHNACVVIDNLGTADHVAVLEALPLQGYEAVREHAAWTMNALGPLSDV